MLSSDVDIFSMKFRHMPYILPANAQFLFQNDIKKSFDDSKIALEHNADFLEFGTFPCQISIIIHDK